MENLDSENLKNLEGHKKLYKLRELEKELNTELELLEEKIKKVEEDIIKIGLEICPPEKRKLWLESWEKSQLYLLNEMIMRQVRRLK